ncbi:MAG: hypothetical protein J6S59_00345 [Clostridia bacterium]|nr:hypothetical protein [Clostridia bacterium]
MLAKLKDRLGALPKTYTYALLLLAAGLLLVLLPRSREETATKPAEQSNAFAENCEARLEEMLSHTAGVGKARVMLTEEQDADRVFARETEREEKTESDGGREFSESSALAMQDSGSDSVPVTETEFAPVWRGALVVCEGADRAEIRLAVTEAVMAVTGLSSDRITVLKLG